jgi:transcriptional regulator with XRE-family HTH domain
MSIVEGRMIRDNRKAHGYTQLELAKEIGLSHGPIYDLENGKENISLKNLRAIADKIGMEVVIKNKNA